MEIQFKRNVRVICDLDVGDKVITDGWGPRLDGRVHIVKEIFPKFGACESGFMVEIDGYDRPIDSSWLIKQ